MGAAEGHTERQRDQVRMTYARVTPPHLITISWKLVATLPSNFFAPCQVKIYPLPASCSSSYRCTLLAFIVQTGAGLDTWICSMACENKMAKTSASTSCVSPFLRFGRP